jgi:hypothetical protein
MICLKNAILMGPELLQLRLKYLVVLIGNRFLVEDEHI